MTAPASVCPACLGSTFGPPFTRRGPAGSADYITCAGCGLLFQRTVPPEGELAGVYDRAYFQLRGVVDATRERADEVRAFRLQTAHRHLDRIESMMGCGTLLDVGCGEGALLEAAAARGWSRRIGVDVSAAAIEQARAFGEVYHGTLVGLALPSSSVDVVAFLDSIEHTPNPAADLREARRILRPGGHVYVVTPDSTHWAARLMGRRWFQLKPDEHLCLFSERALRTILTRAGFEHVEMSAATKVVTPAFAARILTETNPVLGRMVGWVAAVSPGGRRPREMKSGDLVAIARAGANE